MKMTSRERDEWQWILLGAMVGIATALLVLWLGPSRIVSVADVLR